MSEHFRIAAVQAAPVFLDLEATVEKTCGLIAEAAQGGADLVVFPEAFIPGYPVWVWFAPAGHTHPLRDLYAELHRNSVSVPGPVTKRLGEAAAWAAPPVTSHTAMRVSMKARIPRSRKIKRGIPWFIPFRLHGKQKWWQTEKYTPAFLTKPA